VETAYVIINRNLDLFNVDIQSSDSRLLQIPTVLDYSFGRDSDIPAPNILTIFECMRLKVLFLLRCDCVARSM
jgi:hypothetical protein